MRIVIHAVRQTDTAQLLFGNLLCLSGRTAAYNRQTLHDVFERRAVLEQVVRLEHHRRVAAQIQNLLLGGMTGVYHQIIEHDNARIGRLKEID